MHRSAAQSFTLLKVLVIALLTLGGAAANAASGNLSANPATCTIPTGGSNCTSTISWASTGAKDVKVKIQGMTFANAVSGSQAAPWINETPAVFELWGDGTLLATTTVVGQRSTATTPSPTPANNTISANPLTCTIPAGQSNCSTTITWVTTGASNQKVLIEGKTFATGASGSQVAPWIGETPAVFELWGNGAKLSSVTVIGVKTSTSPTPIATRPVNPALDCEARDAATLRACVQSANQRTTHRIAIVNDITCSGAKACHMAITNLTGPLLIYGRQTSGRNRTIKRMDHFDYALVEIIGSTDIEVRDLDFQEGNTNQPAGLFGTPEYDRNTSCDVEQSRCDTTIAILLSSKRIMIDHVSVLESKTHGIEIGNVDDVTIRNSLIKHAWANGIWSTQGDLPVPNEHVPNNFRIENNRFIDNRCSAIEISAMGKSAISGNYLSHNHMGSIYHVPGGQLAIEGNTSGLTIVDNEITDGHIDEDPVLASQGWFTVGLEFTDSHVQNVKVEHNYIHGNSGGAILHDPSPGTIEGFGPIYVMDNVFKQNPPGDIFRFSPSEIVLGSNCSGDSCVYQRPQGQITPNAQTCQANLATGLCTLNFSWSSTSARPTGAVFVNIDGFTFASGTSGSQSAPWISGPARFDLYDGFTLLGSAFVDVAP